MGISRRHVLHAMPGFAVIGRTVFSPQAILAQEVATPAGTPVVADPAALLSRLQAAPVQTPLFPADTGTVTARPWVNEVDRDLIDTVGGVVLETAQDAQGNSIGPGVYLVFPDAAAAQGRLDVSRVEAEFEAGEVTVTSIELAGYPGITIREVDRATTGVAVGPVLAVGLGDTGLGVTSLPGDPALRSLVNCLALLDHLHTVMA